MNYEESVVVYIDFLGFSEASRSLGDEKRRRVLELLVRLANLKSEFKARLFLSAMAIRAAFICNPLSALSLTIL